MKLYGQIKKTLVIKFPKYFGFLLWTAATILLVLAAFIATCAVANYFGTKPVSDNQLQSIDPDLQIDWDDDINFTTDPFIDLTPNSEANVQNKTKVTDGQLSSTKSDLTFSREQINIETEYQENSVIKTSMPQNIIAKDKLMSDKSLQLGMTTSEQIKTEHVSTETSLIFDNKGKYTPDTMSQIRIQGLNKETSLHTNLTTDKDNSFSHQTEAQRTKQDQLLQVDTESQKIIKQSDKYEQSTNFDDNSKMTTNQKQHTTLKTITTTRPTGLANTTKISIKTSKTTKLATKLPTGVPSRRDNQITNYTSYSNKPPKPRHPFYKQTTSFAEITTKATTNVIAPTKSTAQIQFLEDSTNLPTINTSTSLPNATASVDFNSLLEFFSGQEQNRRKRGSVYKPKEVVHKPLREKRLRWALAPDE